MSAHAKAKQRVHTHKGVDFIVVPGSRREQVLLDLFQSEDRLATKPQIVDLATDPEWYHIAWFWIGIAIGTSAVALAWWLV